MGIEQIFFSNVCDALTMTYTQLLNARGEDEIEQATTLIADWLYAKQATLELATSTMSAEVVKRLKQDIAETVARIHTTVDIESITPELTEGQLCIVNNMAEMAAVYSRETVPA